MTLGQYEKLAIRTSPDGHDRVLNGCLGLIGETGEIVDLVKKWKFQSGAKAPIPKNELIEECGDVMWYCNELCVGLGMSLNTLVSAYMTRPHDDIVFDSLIVNACELSKEAFGAYAAMILAVDREKDIENEKSEHRTRILSAHAVMIIPRIVVRSENILQRFCGVILDEALDWNIRKLKARYPKGFDPQRSMNRKK